MSAVINISYAHSTICCCFYCIHISFFIITPQRYVLFPIPPNFSPFFSSAINNQKLAHPRPRRTNNCTSCVKQSRLCCVKQSQFYCVDNHEQPLVGESLFASTEQPVYRLEPTPEEGEPRGRWSPFFKGKEGVGG